MQNGFSPFPAPPESPSLSAFPLSGAGGPAPSQSASVLRAGHAIDQMLTSLASAAPSAAEAIGRIQSELKQIIAGVVQSSSANAASAVGPSTQPPMSGGGSGTPY